MNGIDTVFIVLKRKQKDGPVIWDRNPAPPHMIVFKAAKYTIFSQTACCRGSGGVAKRGLDLCRETAALPGSIFYRKNRYTVTPTFKTPGKVKQQIDLCEKGLFFGNEILLFCVLSSLSHSCQIGLPKSLPDASQMPPKCSPCPCPLPYLPLPLPLLALAPCSSITNAVWSRTLESLFRRLFLDPIFMLMYTSSERNGNLL